MSCRCAGSATTEHASQVNDAMWALAFAATQRSAALVPARYQPMAPHLALEVLAASAAADSGRHLTAAAGMLTRAAFAASGTAPAPRDTNGMRIADLFNFGLIPFVNIAAFLQTPVSLVRWFFEQLKAFGRPCFGPAACGTYIGRTGQTVLASQVTVEHKLSEVAPRIDPRAWDRCSELFKKTCAVVDARACTPVCRPTDPGSLGHDWSGIVYERAGVGFLEVENLLDVCLRAVEVGTPQGQVGVAYSLYRGINCRIGGWDLPGLMQNDSGVMTARAEGEIDSDGEPRQTRIEVSKLIHYRRAGRWSGSRTIDHGELCNYLAPALLTLWVTHLELVVPCCPR